MSDTPSTHSDRPMIAACDLTKHYGTSLAVRGISFSVARGEVVGFLGPNGAGKSTTMKMLTGFLKPTRGSASIAGFDMHEDSLQARACIGYLPENAPLYEDMMVVDFLTFVAQMRGLSPARLKQQMDHVVARCGLQEVLGKDIGQLSRGYRQRVGIAQALVHDPQLLILDEPTSGLDPNQIVEIRALIRDLGRDKTVLLSTHILSEVQAVCSRAIIINRGTLVADDTPENLVASTDGTNVRLVLAGRDGAALDGAAVQEHLQALSGVTRVVLQKAEHPGAPDNEALHFNVTGKSTPDVRQLLFDAAVEHGWRLLEMNRLTQSLEQTFQRLTQGHDAVNQTSNGQASSNQASKGDRHAA